MKVVILAVAAAQELARNLIVTKMVEIGGKPNFLAHREILFTVWIQRLHCMPRI